MKSKINVGFVGRISLLRDLSAVSVGQLCINALDAGFHALYIYRCIVLLLNDSFQIKPKIQKKLFSALND